MVCYVTRNVTQCSIVVCYVTRNVSQCSIVVCYVTRNVTQCSIVVCYVTRNVSQCECKCFNVVKQNMNDIFSGFLHKNLQKNGFYEFFFI